MRNKIATLTLAGALAVGAAVPAPAFAQETEAPSSVPFATSAHAWAGESVGEAVSNVLVAVQWAIFGPFVMSALNTSGEPV